jgi:alcohol dehydrogenase
MKAVVYHEFGGPLTIESLADPSPHADGAVIRVAATGLCRSDWHGWRGNDPDIHRFPHVPGHEFSGVVVDVGRDVPRTWLGQRVTIPFVAGCGTCADCRRGSPQVCARQYQPGFTGWGSFAELVAVRYAAANLVSLPESVSHVAAAALGCRLATAYRAVAARGAAQPSEWVAVHGCGGVGLSAVMVARALGARVIAIDIRPEPLALAAKLGADVTLNAADTADIGSAIRDLTGGGAAVSLDALGSGATFANSILSLRKQGRHVQVGILTKDDVVSPTLVNRIIGGELTLVGSHGIQASAYAGLFALVEAGKLDPEHLVERAVPLESAPQELASLNDYRGCGITVFTPDAGQRAPNGKSE